MNRNRERDRGLALVLVLTIVLALIVVATPFVLSMTKQEQTAATERAEQQALHAADSAGKVPLHMLMRGQDHYERRDPIAPFDTPYSDSSRTDVRSQKGGGKPELAIDPRDQRLVAINAGNSRRPVWGYLAEDEQGKVDIRSAPDRVLRMLRQQIGDQRINDVKDYTTQYATRDAKWIFPQRIRESGAINLPNGKVVNGIRVDDARHFGREARIRFIRAGSTQTVETRVVQNYLLSDQAHVIETEAASAGAHIVEVEARHPVNLNTARRETLMALLEGVRVNNPDPAAAMKDEISNSEAKTVVEAMRTQVFESWQEFAMWLATQQGSLSPGDIAAVMMTFSDPTNVLLDGTGTMPGCFTSADTLWVSARAAVHSEAGTPVSQSGFRQVVDLGSPQVMTWTLESQFDFDRFLSDALIAPAYAATAVPAFLPAGVNNGFPYGNRLVTFPNQYPVVSDKQLKPQLADRLAYWQMDHAPDLRGLASFRFRDHFSDTLEGKKLTGTDQRYDWQRAFSTYPIPASSIASENRPDIAAGSVEFWVRFDSPADMTLFDVREGDNVNRITLEILANELILNVSDATIEDPQRRERNAKGRAQIRMPFTPEKERWYHFTVLYKSTRWSQIGLLVDGFAHPEARFRHVDVDGNPMITENIATIRAEAAPPDMITPWLPVSVSLNNPSWMTDVPVNESAINPVTNARPNWTPILIGDEILHYDKGTREAFRGQRGTVSRDHPANVKAQLFGYSAKVRNATISFPISADAAEDVQLQFNTLPLTGGGVLYQFGANPNATVFGDKTDPVTSQPIIDATQDFVQVVDPATLADYPQAGFIVIDNEAIQYEAIDTTAGRFTGCLRGQVGTAAAQHNQGAPISLWSIAPSDVTGYFSPTIIQINNEWFGPVMLRQTTTPRGQLQNWWTGLVDRTGIPHPMRRNNYFFAAWRPLPLPNEPHAANEFIVPLFAVCDSDVNVPDRRSVGRWDHVTLTDANQTKAFMRVRNVNDPAEPIDATDASVLPDSIFLPSFPGRGRPSWVGWRHQARPQLVGLWDNLPRAYVIDELYTRLLKWPSGELIDVSWLTRANPQVVIGPGTITLDEVKFFGENKGFLLTGGSLDESSKQVMLNPLSGLDPDVGLLKLGDEYVTYTENRGNELRNMNRGFLNTQGHVHAHGELIFNLQMVPISKLTADVGPDDRYLPVVRELQGDNYRRGYALVEQEVVGFEEYTQGAQGGQYDTLEDFKGTGTFRGRYGTTRAPHVRDTIVYALPHRYWDTYSPNTFDNRMAYFQASFARRNAQWRTVSWDERIPAGDPEIRTHCLVRADGLGELHDPPAQTDSTLVWEFIGGTVKAGGNKLDHIASRGELTGQLDVRFLIEFQSGAFWPRHAWKNTPRIEQVRVEYDRPTKVLFHQDD